MSQVRAINIKSGILYRETEGFISFLKWLKDEQGFSKSEDIIDVVEKPWHWHTEWNNYQESVYND